MGFGNVVLIDEPLLIETWREIHHDLYWVT